MLMNAQLCLAQVAVQEQLLRKRVGTSFDSTELAYFGLFSGSEERVDSARYGTISNSFFIEPYSKGKSQRILLNAFSQNEFLNFIGYYERYALDPRSLDIRALQPLLIKFPLKKHERNGYYVSASTLSGVQYFGEILRVSQTHLALYDVDLGYDAQLADSSIRILPLSTLKELKIYKRNVAKYSGLSTGLVLGIALSGSSVSPFPFDNEAQQVAANILVFPAVGFGLGFLLDEVLTFKTTYNMQDSYKAAKAAQRAAKKVMFPNRIPPELAVKLKESIK